LGHEITTHWHRAVYKQKCKLGSFNLGHLRYGSCLRSVVFNKHSRTAGFFLQGGKIVTADMKQSTMESLVATTSVTWQKARWRPDPSPVGF